MLLLLLRMLMLRVLRVAVRGGDAHAVGGGSLLLLLHGLLHRLLGVGSIDVCVLLRLRLSGRDLLRLLLRELLLRQLLLLRVVDHARRVAGGTRGGVGLRVVSVGTGAKADTASE